MEKSLRKMHPPAFKAKVALEAIKEQKTIAELSSIYSVHPTQITRWKSQALTGLEELFSGKTGSKGEDPELTRDLYEQIGKLKVELDWLKKRLALLKDDTHLSSKDLLLHIDKEGVLPITRQTELLGISRGSVYYTPCPIDPFNLLVMNRIDEIYAKRPYYGSRRIAKEISRQWEQPINRKRIQGLMWIMGIEAIYPKPHLSRNGEPHPDYPYLLTGITA